ncbi:MAG: precorrin-3B C(17)-methyltransferase [Verrucomicrobiales bacterium]|nr:precorrin-3B C(17)-methyltransferase [Verrucomicrobiales bacterium]
MSRGVWILREQARSIAEKIARAIGAEVETAVAGENRQAFRERFAAHRQWLIIGASGVATRYVSGLLDSKKSDPAVAVMDEAQRFVIPLVGGHEGGANDLAYEVARVTGASPVVTTATEALKTLVIGIGCRKGVSSQQIDQAVFAALPEGRGIDDIREVVTVDIKANEAGLVDWATGQGLPLRIVASEQIATRPWVSKPSDWVQENLDLPGVCEPVALIACPRGELVVAKSCLDGVCVAVVEDGEAELMSQLSLEPQKGKLTMVSLGPGNRDFIPPRARAAIANASEVVGYGLYLDLIEPWLHGKTEHRMPLTQEKARAEKAIELAEQGKQVALVSSGDIGIYAMATLVFELLEKKPPIEIEVIPGITAATSCAALLGAPLSHDFATLSLSDLLCPWQWIERRAKAIAESDLAVALYNVQSKSRPDGVQRILDIMLQHKSPQTVCGVVRNACREDQELRVCTLAELKETQFDMLTTVIIGNQHTRNSPAGMFSPRGYLDWKSPKKNSDIAEDSVWVFAGTHDGNALANALVEKGHSVVVSVATDYGVEVAESALDERISVVNAAVGSGKRREMLSGAKAVVDASHPFAQLISQDLMASCQALDLPYFRYERPSNFPKLKKGEGLADFKSALLRAAELGKRVFLATGAKELALLKDCPRAGDAEWFVRFAPDASSLKIALDSGIPRNQLCFMQGPFSADFNETQWRDWKIDCVVTRESGEGSGMAEKIEAAERLLIPVLVIQRPAMSYPNLFDDFAAVIERVGELV